MYEKNCKNCEFAKPVGYEQVICKRRNEWFPELYSCSWFRRHCEYRHYFGSIVLCSRISGVVDRLCDEKNCPEGSDNKK